MKPYLALKDDPAESFSFLIGDRIRIAFFKPWKIIFFPFTFLQLIQLYRKKKNNILISNIDILFIIDAEMLTDSDLTFVRKVIGSKSNDLIASIGELELPVEYLIPSRKSNTSSKSQWNQDFEYLLQSIIISRRPRKIVFIGKYPYAGLLSLIRRLESNVNVAWLPMRSKSITIEERASRFGNVIKWSHVAQVKSEYDSISIHIGSKFTLKLKDIIEDKAKEKSLTITNPLNTGLHIYSETDIGRIQNTLDRGQIVIYLFKSQINPSFSSSKYATIFMPVQTDNLALLESSISQIMDLYLEGKIAPINQEQELIERWIETLETTFTQTNS